MQRESKELLVIHPVFGTIRIGEKFKKVLELKPFRELAYKSQLGTKIFSKKLLNARHTRLMHSIGVFYLTGELLNICDDKFNKYFDISTEDKEVLLLAALGHDLGHIAFSHSLEDRNMKTHEERTIEYFEQYSDEINEIFGYDVVSKVIQIYKDKESKSSKVTFDADDLNMLFIFKSLLIGAVDADRMEYITTDRFNVYGESVNYKDIFKYITIVLLNDSPTVGFESDAVPTIEDMLFTRFNQYLEIYYDPESILTEMILKEYKHIEGWDEEETVSKSEFEVLTEFKKILCDPEEYGGLRYRLAQIILEGNRENVMFKKFEDDEEFECFIQKLGTITKRKDIIKTSRRKVTLYDPNKDKVYIKDKDGVVKDLMDVSKKIRNITVNCNYVMIDLDPVYGIDLAEAQNIRELFTDNPVEIEKKFILDKGITDRYWKDKVNFAMQSIPNIKIKDFEEWEIEENDDVYFEARKHIPKEVAMRCRTKAGEKVYYVKTPADDGTSITKRNEDKFYCKSNEEFFKVVTPFLKSKGYGYYADDLEIKESVRIKTVRYKTLAEVHDSVIEIACDFSTYKYAGKFAIGMMLECEFKDGDDISLWYLSKYLKSQGFIETNESKETKAKKALGIE